MNFSLFGILVFLCLVAVIVGVSALATALRYHHSRHPQGSLRFPAKTRTVILIMLIYTLVAAAAVAVGQLCMPVTGLRAPLFEAMAAFKPFWQGLDQEMLPALLSGVAGGLAWIGLYYGLMRRFLDEETLRRSDTIHQRIGFGGKTLLGGIYNEIVFRFGIANLLAWAAITLGATTVPAAWIGFLVSGLLSAAADIAGHRWVGITLPRQFAAVLILRKLGIAALCGWMFSSYGLFAAILTHLVVIIILSIADSICRWIETGRL